MSCGQRKFNFIMRLKHKRRNVRRDNRRVRLRARYLNDNELSIASRCLSCGF